MTTISFPKLKDASAMEQKNKNGQYDTIPQDVNRIKETLESICPKERGKYILEKDFLNLCKEKQVYVVVGCTKTHSIRIISPDKEITTVHFFDNQTKNVLKSSESVVMTNKHGVLTTNHKRKKPLPIKQMNDDMINNIIAEIYVGIRKIIFGNKKIGTRDVMGVWIKDYPYINVSIGDYNNKNKDDILLFSAKELKKYQPMEIDRIICQNR